MKTSEKLSKLVMDKQTFSELIGSMSSHVIGLIMQSAPASAEKETLDKLSAIVQKFSLKRFEENFDRFVEVSRISLEECYSDEEIEQLYKIYTDNPWMLEKAKVFAQVNFNLSVKLGQQIGDQVSNDLQTDEEFNSLMDETMDEF